MKICCLNLMLFLSVSIWSAFENKWNWNLVALAQWDVITISQRHSFTWPWKETDGNRGDFLFFRTCFKTTSVEKITTFLSLSWPPLQCRTSGVRSNCHAIPGHRKRYQFSPVLPSCPKKSMNKQDDAKALSQVFDVETTGYTWKRNRNQLHFSKVFDRFWARFWTKSSKPVPSSEFPHVLPRRFDPPEEQNGHGRHENANWCGKPMTHTSTFMGIYGYPPMLPRKWGLSKRLLTIIVPQSSLNKGMPIDSHDGIMRLPFPLLSGCVCCSFNEIRPAETPLFAKST